jgi:nucleoid-associated protein YgaU
MSPAVETAAEKAAREAKERAAAATKAKLDVAAGARADAVRAGEKEVRAKLDAAVASARETAEAAKALLYTVKAGDTLGTIAKASLGDASRWTEIYELNKAAIGADPNMVKAGVVLRLPR